MTDEELKAIEAALGGPLGFTYDGSSAWSVGPAADPQSGRIVVHDRNDERAKALCAALVAAPSLVAEVRRLRDEADNALYFRRRIEEAIRLVGPFVDPQSLRILNTLNGSRDRELMPPDGAAR